VRPSSSNRSPVSGGSRSEPTLPNALPGRPRSSRMWMPDPPPSSRSPRVAVPRVVDADPNGILSRPPSAKLGSRTAPGLVLSTCRAETAPRARAAGETVRARDARPIAKAKIRRVALAPEAVWVLSLGTDQQTMIGPRTLTDQGGIARPRILRSPFPGRSRTPPPEGVLWSPGTPGLRGVRAGGEGA